MDDLRIGILGAARIAPAAVIKPARRVDGVRVAAVAARDRARADAFAAKHGIPTVHAAYDDAGRRSRPRRRLQPAAQRPARPVDDRPPSMPASTCCARSRSRPTRDEAVEVAAAAERAGLVVIEAFHYRYHPLARRMREIVDERRAGPPAPRRGVELLPAAQVLATSATALDLAGGARMDAGCYAVHMAAPGGRGRARGGLGTGPAALARASIGPCAPTCGSPAGHTGRIVCSMWSRSLLRLAVRVIGEARRDAGVQPHRAAVPAPAVGAHRRRPPGRALRVARPTYALPARGLPRRGRRPAATNLTPPSDAIANMAVIDAIYRAAGLEPRQPSTAGPDAHLSVGPGSGRSRRPRGGAMREHRYSFEMPHSAARIWALFQDYERWTDYAPMVKRVDVLWPGDDDHNGRLRRVIYQMPLGSRGLGARAGQRRRARAGLHVHDDLGPGRQRPDRPHPPRAARPQPHPLLVRRALQPDERSRSSGSRAGSTRSSTRRTRRACDARRPG